MFLRGVVTATRIGGDCVLVSEGIITLDDPQA